MTDGTFDNLVVNNSLGIGTTELAAQLHVAATEGISSKIFVESINGGLLQVTAEPKSASIGTANAFPLSINTNGLSRIQISSDGNVGIGTTEPGAKLHIHGSSNSSNSLLLTRDEGGPYMRFKDKEKFAEIQFVGAANLLHISDGTGRTLGNIALQGNVGIGTTNPAAKLHIYSNDNNALKITNTALSKAAMMGVDSLGVWIEPSETNSSIRLNANPGLIGLYVKGTDGNIGIGTRDPKAKLDVAGEVRASNFPTVSDLRLKKGVIKLTNVLEKLEKIRGVSFEWNEMYESLGHSTGHREIGVMAQEVEAVFPEMVTTWGEEGYKAVDYGRLTSVLIEAAKELNAQNSALKQRIEVLEKAMADSQAKA